MSTVPGGPRTALGQIVKVAAATTDRLRRPGSGVVVLLYHRVGGGSASRVDLPEALFRAQMEWLAASGRIVDLDTALAVLAGWRRPAVDPVVVTFDDGTADFVDHAVPVMAELGVPSTVYVATDHVDRGIEFPGGAPAASWRGLADAVSTGLVAVGSHTHSHALIDRLAPAAVVEELDRSCSLIGDRLGTPALHFAYPKALDGSPGAAAEVRRRFRSAALAGTRPNPYGRTDPYRLARSPVQAGDGMRWFRHKAEGGMALEDDLRRIVNRWRYAGAST